MSLYIGNLSARTRKDELERVFRRFGECDLRLKDGYGFVVYGFAPQAEKAMKLLQGRAICGQQLTITWSNKQPRPGGRAHRPFEPRRRDFPARFRQGIKLPENGSDDVVVDGDEDEGDEELGGRWGERAENEDSSNEGGEGVGGRDAMMTDRYDPYRGYDRRDKDGDRWTEENSGEREQDVAHGSMFRINCFSCGELGHKMRDCPAKRGKFNRFDNDLNQYRLERYPRHRNNRATEKYGNAPEIDRDEDDHVEKKKKKKKRESKFSKRLVGSESAESASRSGSKHPKRRPRSRSRSVTRPRSSSSSGSRSVSRSRHLSPSPPPLDPNGSEIPEPLDRTTLDGVTVSVEEMSVALKHFGAEIPGEREKHGSLEALFGSARLWPWEGIYYRRVKKGPISVENYERRVAQNREFGIVDRFVRSSSGWGEMSQKNP